MALLFFDLAAKKEVIINFDGLHLVAIATMIAIVADIVKAIRALEPVLVGLPIRHPTVCGALLAGQRTHFTIDDVKGVLVWALEPS